MIVHDTVNKRVTHTQRGRADDTDSQIIVGGDASDDYYPEIKIVHHALDPLSIVLADSLPPWATVVDEPGEKTVIDAGDVKAEFYVDDNQRFEFGVWLGSKPPGNKRSWSFNLVGWENYEFNFQPDASQFPGAFRVQEDWYGDGQLHWVWRWTDGDGNLNGRLEDMCGGFVVKHISKRDNEYKTGLLAEIPRPKFIQDYGGAESYEWGDIQIIDGVITVTAPGNFLNTATYPVFVDPTFGLTSVGSSDVAMSNNASCSQYSPSSSGDVTSIHGVFKFASGDNFEVAMYDDSSNSPNNKMVEGGPAACVNNNFVSVSVTSTAVTGSTNYWLAYQADGGVNHFYNSGSGNSCWWSQTYSTWEDPHGGCDGTASDRDYSVYATYTESAGNITEPVPNGTLNITSIGAKQTMLQIHKIPPQGT